MSRTLLVRLAVFGLLAPVCGATVIYVDDNAPLGGDGTNWGTAHVHLRDALAAAGAGDEVHVAGGVYRPDRTAANPIGSGSRFAAFALASGVALRGGYAGLAEPNDPEARNVDVYTSILSGDLAGNDGPDFTNMTENAYHVITADLVDASAVLDGFTIQGGNSNNTGGGLDLTLAGPTIVNCRFSANRAYEGAALYDFSGTPQLIDCRLENNRATFGGGGLYANQSQVALIGCTFVGHTGGAVVAFFADELDIANCQFHENTGADGGAAYVAASNATFINCVMSHNLAACGGGLHLDNSQVTITNCTFAGNGAELSGGAVCVTNGTADVRNSILWDNSAPTGPQIALEGSATTLAVAYTDAEGDNAAAAVGADCTLTWGLGNLDADPFFVAPEAFDFRLAAGSPCLDAGNNSAMPRDVLDLDADGCRAERVPVDIAGQRRRIDDAALDTGVGPGVLVDLGAYERGTELPTWGDTCPGDLNCDGVLTLGDVNPFVLALSDADRYLLTYPTCARPNADCNFDGQVTFADINAFVDLIGTLGTP